jgi:molecular chaperone GrpE
MPDEKTDPHDTNETGVSEPKITPAAGAPEAGDAEGQMRADLDALLAENAEMRDRLLRTLADMENLRRRAEQEKADIARYAISNFAREILTLGDNLQRTIDHLPAEAAAQDPALKSFLDGVQITERELLNVLERHGVTRIEPLGQRFDPNCHQAMFEVVNDDLPDGTVVEVMQPGYVIGDRCLRPALVAVAKGDGKAPAQDEKEAAEAQGQNGNSGEETGARGGTNGGQ